LADLGLAPVEDPASPGDLASTQVLPLTTASRPGPPPPPAPASPAAPTEPASTDQPPRRPWPLVVGATVVVVAAVVAAFVIGLHGSGDDSGRPASHGAGSGSGSPSGSRSGSATSPSESDGAAPTEAGMTSFIRTYIDTAVDDPQTAFAMLTPEYQAESKGLSGYESFWGDVKSAKILGIEADPASLRVTYRYRYVKPGGPTVEDVTLQLAFSDGSYRIAGQR
jgi:hypothetical protein